MLNFCPFFEALSLIQFQPYLCPFDGSITFICVFVSLIIYIYINLESQICYCFEFCISRCTFTNSDRLVMILAYIDVRQFCAVALYCYVKLLVDFYMNISTLSLSLFACVSAWVYVDLFLLLPRKQFSWRSLLESLRRTFLF